MSFHILRGAPRPRRLATLALRALEDRCTPANLVVTSVADSGVGSLRAVIATANTNGEADTITFDSTTFATPQTITLTTGEIALANSVTINGPAAQLTISGNNASRIFTSTSAASTSTLTLSSMTFTNGRAATGAGGAIYAQQEYVTLNHCRFLNNTAAAGNGGALATTIHLSAFAVADCELTNNSASGAGGAIFDSGAYGDSVLRCSFTNNHAGSAGGLSAGYGMTIDSCTFVGNVATGPAPMGLGGGVVAGGSTTIRSCTISGNSASVSGGAISIASINLSLLNSTIVENSATVNGGGIFRNSGSSTVSLTSSIVAKNVSSAGPDMYFNASTSITAKNNLIGVANNGNFILAGTNNLTGTLVSPLDPLLGPLTNNGGATLTREPLPGSPAIDAGINSTSLFLDQRGDGFLRRIDTVGVPDISDGTDIGAIEIGQVLNPAAGKLDPTFGIGGQTTLRFPVSESDGTATTIDKLGRIVVVGSTCDGVEKVFAVARFLPDGSLDNNFNGSGAVTVAFGQTNDYASGVAVDSMGRIVVVGSTYNGSNTDFAVARLLDNGALDPSFNNIGKITIAFGTSQDTALSVAIDSADRVVVAGSTFLPGGNSFAVARLTTSGALDTSFDGDGKATIGNASSANAVALDSAGRVVLAGSNVTGPNSSYRDFAAARLLADGSPDSSFNGTGTATVSFGLAINVARGLAIDANDRLILAGYNLDYVTYKSQFAVARLTVNGAVDSSFNGNGLKTFDFGGYTASGQGVRIDSSNRIVVAGQNNPTFTGGIQFAAARLNDDGSFDTSFNNTGQVTLPAGLTSRFLDVVHGANSVAIDASNNVILFGTEIRNLAGPTMSVARITAAGSLDTTFAANGEALANFLTNSQVAAAGVAVDHQGRVVVAGNVYDGVGYKYAVTRYLPNGALDTSFHVTGTLTFDMTSAYQIQGCTSVTIDAIDRILVAGYVGTSNDFAVARINPDGEFDLGFGNSGKQVIDLVNSDDFATSINLDSLGRVVITGHSHNGPVQGFAAVRLTPTGELDMSFGTNGTTIYAFPGDNDPYSAAAAVDSTNRIIIVGSTYVSPTVTNVEMIRLTASGLLDPSFAGGGATTFAFGSTSCRATSVVIDPLGRIVVGGNSSGTGLGVSLCGLARFTADGVLDPTFDGDGKTTFSFSGTGGSITALMLDPAGQIVVAGSNSIGTGSSVTNQFAVARLTASGFFDPNFNRVGQSIFDFGDVRGIARAVTMDSFGRIIVAGDTQTAGPENVRNGRFAIARLTGDNPTGPPAKVASVIINDGGAQRSRVTSLRITFDQYVTLPSNPTAGFVLTRQNDNAHPNLIATVDNSGASTVVTLTFTGTAAVEFNSLADGRYTLSLLASKLNGGYFDGNADGTPGDDYVLVGSPANGLFRLFGDSDGNGVIDGVDYGAFRAAFNTNNTIFSFDGAGPVDGVDFGQFRQRFGVMI